MDVRTRVTSAPIWVRLIIAVVVGAVIGFLQLIVFSPDWIWDVAAGLAAMIAVFALLSAERIEVMSPTQLTVEERVKLAEEELTFLVENYPETVVKILSTTPAVEVRPTWYTSADFEEAVRSSLNKVLSSDEQRLIVWNSIQPHYHKQVADELEHLKQGLQSEIDEVRKHTHPELETLSSQIEAEVNRTTAQTLREMKSDIESAVNKLATGGAS